MQGSSSELNEVSNTHIKSE